MKIEEKTRKQVYLARKALRALHDHLMLQKEGFIDTEAHDCIVQSCAPPPASWRFGSDQLQRILRDARFVSWLEPRERMVSLRNLMGYINQLDKTKRSVMMVRTVQTHLLHMDEDDQSDAAEATLEFFAPVVDVLVVVAVWKTELRAPLTDPLSEEDC